jgi:ABC-type sulfate transport system permease component
MSVGSRPASANVRAIPGFGLAFGITAAWLGAIVLVPLAALVIRPWELGVAGVWASLTEPRVVAALRLSFGAALLAAAVNVPAGLLIAWAIVRLRFPGRATLDGAVDLPFALPTAVAGIALTALFATNGWLGAPLAAVFGWQVAFTPGGVVVALVFVGLPFVVRTVEPVLRDLTRDAEEAAATLGATRPQVLWRIVLPAPRARPAHRLRPRLRTRGGRVRERHLHRRQHADGERDRAAADRHPAGAVRLCRRRRDWSCDAAVVLRHPAGAQPGAARAAARRVSASRPATRVSAFRNATEDAPWARWLIASVALLLGVLLLGLPLAAVFVEALRRGIPVALAALADEDTLAAIRLTLLVAAIAVPLNTLGGIAAAWCVAKHDFRGSACSSRYQRYLNRLMRSQFRQ